MAVDVRRLAAVDMHGAKGTTLRSRLILIEFIGGAVIGPVLGVGVAIPSEGIGWLLFGVWLIGACLNYVPLAVYAIGFSRRGALASELSGVDIPNELRYYTKAQVWVFVPLALVVADVRQRLGRSSTGHRQEAADTSP